MLGPARVLVSGWVDIQGVAASARYIAWHGTQTGDPHRDPQKITLLQRSTGRMTTLATAPSPAGLVAWLRISDEWAAWADYTDVNGLRDWRLRSARLPDGPAVTLMEAPTDAVIADRPEFDLRGHELLVTGRPKGATSPELVRIDLESGMRRLVLRAKRGEAFGWPSFDGDAMFVESYDGAKSTLLAVRMDGGAVPLTTDPASEPSASNGWLAYKGSERGSLGPVALRSLAAASQVVIAAPGEAPSGSDGVFAWMSEQPERKIYAFDSTSQRLYASVPIARSTAILMVVGSAGSVVFTSRSLEPPMTAALQIVDIP